jgi:hypothetical protein
MTWGFSTMTLNLAGVGVNLHHQLLRLKRAVLKDKAGAPLSAEKKFASSPSNLD